MADKIGGYGVLVDLHRPRQDGGVPCLWDGWYQDRADALEALRLVEKRYPRVARLPCRRGRPEQ
jgi:hypothetical protein